MTTIVMHNAFRYPRRTVPANRGSVECYEHPSGLTTNTGQDTPIATNTHTTPTRRSALGFSTAAIVAGMITPVLAVGATPNADATLLDLVKALAQHEAATHVIAAEQKSLPSGITPASDDADQRMDDALDAWFRTVEQITNTPARTPQGLRAKADALRMVLTCLVCDWGNDLGAIEDAETEDMLAWSLVRDLLGGSVGV